MKRFWGGILALFWLVMAFGATANETVNDITQLNPITVEKVVAPTTVEEVADLIAAHNGPMSIGGGRYSQGGQTACDACLFIDMRQLNHVVHFDKARKQITVQAGMNWRTVQEVIDPENLSMRIMQSFSNFTVGGSLSVNAHGRYVGEGPIIHSVESFKIILADGGIKVASRSENPDLFYGAIGGYGGLGVIVEVTLNLTDNVPLELVSKRMKVTAYKAYFDETVKGSTTAVFHNATLYPNAYKSVNVLTFSRTDKPLDIKDRLAPAAPADGVKQALIKWLTNGLFGKSIKERIYDPMLYGRSRVAWRNYDASLDVSTIEPKSRAKSTYALQEYFIPEAQFDAFVPRLRDILQKHKVNVLNVAIRHARADEGSLLRWARTDVFAFVIYYEQGVSEADKQAVGEWTRELIAAAIDQQGTYYLPYQIHATREQFITAYPGVNDFFALKKRVDPDYKFRNRLWEAYYRPNEGMLKP